MRGQVIQALKLVGNADEPGPSPVGAVSHVGKGAVVETAPHAETVAGPVSTFSGGRIALLCARNWDPTSVCAYDDVVAPAKVLIEQEKKSEHLKIKIGQIAGKVVQLDRSCTWYVSPL